MELFQSGPGYGPSKNKTAGMVRDRLLILQRRIADRLNAGTEAVSGRILLAALVVFCSLGTLLCLGLILGKIK